MKIHSNPPILYYGFNMIALFCVLKLRKKYMYQHIWHQKNISVILISAALTNVHTVRLNMQEESLVVTHRKSLLPEPNNHLKVKDWRISFTTQMDDINLISPAFICK